MKPVQFASSSIGNKMVTLLACGLILLVHSTLGENASTTKTSTKSKYTNEFFPEVKGNLTKITWAHAVNSEDELASALNSTIMMLEADVVMGTVDASQKPIPIMGHPPANTSDISLQTFLEKIQEYNSNPNNTAKKGVKLDFKTIEVFEESVNILKLLYSKMDYPVWINADILAGPGNTTGTPVDASKFIEAGKTFTNATLSLGWKTSDSAMSNTSYTDEQLNEMENVIDKSNISQPITFPVRAGPAALTPNLKRLVTNVTDSTLTLWHGKGDIVNIEPLRKLIKDVGLSRVYIDLPDEIKNQLKLNELNGGGIARLSMLSVIVAALMRLL